MILAKTVHLSVCLTNCQLLCPLDSLLILLLVCQSVKQGLNKQFFTQRKCRQEMGLVLITWLTTLMIRLDNATQHNTTQGLVGEPMLASPLTVALATLATNTHSRKRARAELN